MRKEVDKVNRFSPEPVEDILEAIHAITHLYRARQYRAPREDGAGLPEISHMEDRVLGYFGARPGATQRDLVLHSGRDKAQVARLVQGLRDKGLLEARLDSADRRSTRLQLSPAGETVYAHLLHQGRLLAARALEGLDAGERAQLAHLLARVRDNLGKGEMTAA